MQGDDERPPLLLIGALGKQLLKLVNDEQHSPLPRPVWQAIVLRGGAQMGQGGLPGGQGETRRVSGQSSQHCGGVRARYRRHPHRQLL